MANELIPIGPAKQVASTAIALRPYVPNFTMLGNEAIRTGNQMGPYGRILVGAGLAAVAVGTALAPALSLNVAAEPPMPPTPGHNNGVPDPIPNSRLVASAPAAVSATQAQNMATTFDAFAKANFKYRTLYDQKTENLSAADLKGLNEYLAAVRARSEGTAQHANSPIARDDRFKDLIQSAVASRDAQKAFSDARAALGADAANTESIINQVVARSANGQETTRKDVSIKNPGDGKMQTFDVVIDNYSRGNSSGQAQPVPAATAATPAPAPAAAPATAPATARPAPAPAAATPAPAPAAAPATAPAAARPAPAPAAAATPAPAPAPTPAPAPATVPATSDGKIVIQPGDSLSKIARGDQRLKDLRREIEKSLKTTDELTVTLALSMAMAEANGIKKPDHIEPGWTIDVAKTRSKLPQVIASISKHPAMTDAQTPGTLTLDEFKGPQSGLPKLEGKTTKDILAGK